MSMSQKTLADFYQMCNLMYSQQAAEVTSEGLWFTEIKLSFINHLLQLLLLEFSICIWINAV